jgi:hypothetical protein
MTRPALVRPDPETATDADWEALELELRTRLIMTVVANERDNRAWCSGGKLQILSQCLLGIRYNDLAEQDYEAYVSIDRLISAGVDQRVAGVPIPRGNNQSYEWLFHTEQLRGPRRLGKQPRTISGTVTVTYRFQNLESEEGGDERVALEQALANADIGNGEVIIERVDGS